MSLPAASTPSIDLTKIDIPEVAMKSRVPDAMATAYGGRPAEPERSMLTEDLSLNDIADFSMRQKIERLRRIFPLSILLCRDALLTAKGDFDDAARILADKAPVSPLSDELLQAAITREALLERQYELNQTHISVCSEQKLLEGSWRTLKDPKKDKKRLAKFPRFPYLPLELRTEIWKFAFVPRVMEFTQKTVYDEFEGWSSWVTRDYGTPGIHRACHESRKIFLKHYIPYSVSNDLPDEGFSIFINPEIDTFYFDMTLCEDLCEELLPAFLTNLEVSSRDKQAVSKIKKVAFDARVLSDWVDHHFNHQVELRACLPGMEEVVFVENRILYTADGELCDGDFEIKPRKAGKGWSTNAKFAGNETFLAPFHEYELMAWEKRMAEVGYLLCTGDEWDGVKISVAKMLRGKEVGRKAPLVDYQSVMFGPANKHEFMDDWVEATSEE